MKNDIISWITGKSNLSEVSLQELQDIVYKYPYFTLAQLLLTVKMKSEHIPGYEQQLHRTALNFQDPQWLHFQLASLSYTGNSIHENEEVVVMDNSQDDNDASTISTEEEHIVSNPVMETQEHIQETSNNFFESNPIDAISDQTDEISETNEENLNIEEQHQPEALLDSDAIHIESESTPALDIISEKEEEIETPNTSDAENWDVESKDEYIAEQETPSETINEQAEEEIEEIAHDSDQTEANNLTETPDENAENTFAEDISEATIISKEQLPDKKEIETISQEIASSKLSSIIAAQAEVFKSSLSKESSGSLSYDEPKRLATKDYFASIGVRIDPTISNDFSKKVRKFSDWLKQMKKVGPEQLIRDSDPKEDEAIIKKADDSNKQAEVVTESMVQVLLQQGKKSEAVEILQKLSLLKPEKSAYFASQIDFLKDNK